MHMMDFGGHVITSQASIPDQTDTIARRFFAHATWQNLSAPSSIGQTRLNSNDSHPSVSFELLIVDEEPNPIVTPNLAYKIHMFFDNVKHSRVF